MLDATPPTVASTHPSNIAREELFLYMKNPRETSLQELTYILENVKPKVVIARKGKRIFDKKFEELNAYINPYLEEHYMLKETIGRGLIYQRLE